MSAFDGLPKSKGDQPCRDPHRLEHATGADYVIENVIGVGALATNGAVINGEGFAVPGPGFCPSKLKNLKGASNIPQ